MLSHEVWQPLATEPPTYPLLLGGTSNILPSITASSVFVLDLQHPALNPDLVWIILELHGRYWSTIREGKHPLSSQWEVPLGFWLGSMARNHKPLTIEPRWDHVWPWELQPKGLLSKYSANASRSMVAMGPRRGQEVEAGNVGPIPKRNPAKELKTLLSIPNVPQTLQMTNASHTQPPSNCSLSESSWDLDSCGIGFFFLPLPNGRGKK